MSRGDSECSLERWLWLERDTPSETGRRKARKRARIRARERREAKGGGEEFEGVPARLRQRYVRPPRVRTKILQSRDVPTRKTERRQGRGNERERTRTKTREDSRGQDREFQELLSGFKHGRLHHRLVPDRT